MSDAVLRKVTCKSNAKKNCIKSNYITLLHYLCILRYITFAFSHLAEAHRHFLLRGSFSKKHLEYYYILSTISWPQEQCMPFKRSHSITGNVLCYFCIFCLFPHTHECACLSDYVMEQRKNFNSENFKFIQLKSNMHYLTQVTDNFINLHINI